MLEYLKYVLDGSHAVGINIQRCIVRYHIIKYVAHGGNSGDTGLYFEGNLLSALITNGTFREPGVNGTIMTDGSTLYRWSRKAYLVTFHNVNIRP